MYGRSKTPNQNGFWKQVLHRQRFIKLLWSCGEIGTGMENDVMLAG